MTVGGSCFWRPNRGGIIHSSLGCSRERDRRAADSTRARRSRGNTFQVIATVVVVQSFEGFGSAVSPSEPVQTVNAA
jgi:hypothetical protein